MFAKVIVQLAPLPLSRIRALQLFHLFVSRPKASEQQLVAPPRGILAKSGFGILESVEHYSRVRSVYCFGRILAEDGRLESLAKMPAEPDFVERGRCRVGVHHGIPSLQQGQACFGLWVIARKRR